MQHDTSRYIPLINKHSKTFKKNPADVINCAVFQQFQFYGAEVMSTLRQ